MCAGYVRAQQLLSSLGLEVEKLETLDGFQFDLLGKYMNYLEKATSIDAATRKTRERSKADEGLKPSLESLLMREYDSFLRSFLVLLSNKKYKDATKERDELLELLKSRLPQENINKALHDSELDTLSWPSNEAKVDNTTGTRSPNTQAGGEGWKRAVGKRRADMIRESDENPESSNGRKRRRGETAQGHNSYSRRRKDDVADDQLPNVTVRDTNTYCEIEAQPLATAQTTSNTIRKANNTCPQEARDAKPQCETEAQTLTTGQDAHLIGDSTGEINNDHLQEARGIHTHCEIGARIMAASQTTGDAITYLDLISRCFRYAIRNDHAAYYLHLTSLIQQVKPPITEAELPENLRQMIGPLITVSIVGQEGPGEGPGLSKEARLQWLSNNIRETSSYEHIKALQVEQDLELLSKVHHDLLFDRIQPNTGNLKELKELEELDRVLGDRENTREATDMRTGEDSLFGSGGEEDEFKETRRAFSDPKNESAKYDRYVEDQAGLQARIQILVKERDSARAERDEIEVSMKGKLEEMTQYAEVAKERDMMRRQMVEMEQNAQQQKKRAESELGKVKNKNAELIRELETRQSDEGHRPKDGLSAPSHNPQSSGRGAATSSYDGALSFIQGGNGCKRCGNVQHCNTKLSSPLLAHRKADVKRPHRVQKTKERKRIAPDTVDSFRRSKDSVTEDLQKRLFVIEGKNAALKEKNVELNGHNAELANQNAKLTGQLNATEEFTERLNTSITDIICFMFPDPRIENLVSYSTPSNLPKIIEEALTEFVRKKNAITSSLGDAVRILMCQQANILFRYEVDAETSNRLKTIGVEIMEFSDYDDRFIEYMGLLYREISALEEKHHEKLKRKFLAGLSVINLYLKASLRQSLGRSEDENICDTLEAASLWCCPMLRHLSFVLHSDKNVPKEYGNIYGKLNGAGKPDSRQTMPPEYKQLFGSLKEMTYQSRSQRNEIDDLLKEIFRVWAAVRDIQGLPQTVTSVSSSAGKLQLEDILDFVSSKNGQSCKSGSSQRVEYTNIAMRTDASPSFHSLVRASDTDCEEQASETKKPTRYEPIDCTTQTDLSSCHNTDHSQQTDTPSTPIDCATQTGKFPYKTADHSQQTENPNKTIRNEPIDHSTQTDQLLCNNSNRGQQAGRQDKPTDDEAIDCAAQTEESSYHNTDHAQQTVNSDRTLNSATQTDQFSCHNIDHAQQTHEPNDPVDCATQTGKSSFNYADCAQQTDTPREPASNRAMIDSGTQTDEFTYLDTNHAQGTGKPSRPVDSATQTYRSSYRYTNHAQQTDKSLSHGETKHRLMTGSSRADSDDEKMPKNEVLNCMSPTYDLTHQGDSRPRALDYAQPLSISTGHATPTYEEGSRADFAFKPLQTSKRCEQNAPECIEALEEVAFDTLPAQVEDSARDECQGPRISVPFKGCLEVNGESWVVEDVKRLLKQYIVTLSRGSELKSLTLREILDLDTAQEVNSNSRTLYNRFQSLFAVDIPRALLFKGVVNVFPAGRGWSCTVEYRNSRERHRVAASTVGKWGKHAQMALNEAKSAFQAALPNRQTSGNPKKSGRRACGCVHAPECPETRHTGAKG